MTTDELLLQLRDIQPPPEPAWWLPGPAHILAAILTVSLISAAWWLLKRHRADRLAQAAYTELQRIRQHYREAGDRTRLALALSRWLKRVAIKAYPDRQVPTLHGTHWLQLLDRDLQDQPFSQGCGQLFGDRIYQREIDFDEAQVLHLCEQWFQSVRPKLRRQRASP